jgi:hypothetical protein
VISLLKSTVDCATQRPGAKVNNPTSSNTVDRPRLRQSKTTADAGHRYRRLLLLLLQTSTNPFGLLPDDNVAERHTGAARIMYRRQPATTAAAEEEEEPRRRHVTVSGASAGACDRNVDGRINAGALEPLVLFLGSEFSSIGRTPQCGAHSRRTVAGSADREWKAVSGQSIRHTISRGQ